MREKTNISVILPIHELDENTKKLFTNAIQSVAQQITQPDEVIIVVPKGSEAAAYVKAYDFGTINAITAVIENDGATDFASQINFGVANINSEWFSILEFDDEYAKIWFKNVVQYRAVHNNVDIFMPIVVDVDNNGQFIGFTNEAVWATNFSDALGILDNNSLNGYQNFNIDGMVMKKSTYVEFGGFKPNIKLTFIYEFLLRMTFKAVQIMTIPRFGYKHVNQRPGSLFSIYKETLDAVEAKWWLSQAKKESYFKADRKITYETQTK